jgi:hypothetical protein
MKIKKLALISTISLATVFTAAQANLASNLPPTGSLQIQNNSGATLVFNCAPLIKDTIANGQPSKQRNWNKGILVLFSTGMTMHCDFSSNNVSKGSANIKRTTKDDYNITLSNVPYNVSYKGKAFTNGIAFPLETSKQVIITIVHP